MISLIITLITRYSSFVLYLFFSFSFNSYAYHEIKVFLIFRYSAQILLKNALICWQNARLKNRLFCYPRCELHDTFFSDHVKVFPRSRVKNRTTSNSNLKRQFFHSSDLIVNTKVKYIFEIFSLLWFVKRVLLVTN